MDMKRLVGLLLVALGFTGSAFGLVSEGRPGIPYFNHVLFLDRKIEEGGSLSWVTLTYSDTRQQTLDCRNRIDVFAGKELFRDIPEKTWVLVDYEMQSILIEDGFFGDADVFQVIPCGDVDDCCRLRDKLNADPAEQARQAAFSRPEKTQPAKVGALAEELEVGRQLVKAARCRGCHQVEGFGAEHAPSLTWKRYKYEKGWLESFLRAPYRLRPAMTDLMMLDFTSPNAVPSLQSPEVTAVADYLGQVAWAKTPGERFRGEPWSEYDCYGCHRRLYLADPLPFVPTAVPDALWARVSGLGVMQLCFSCHAFGDRMPAHLSAPNRRQVMAPDLLLSMEKLEVNYFVNFVRDPGYLQPGALMPTLGFSEDQFRAIRAAVVEFKEAIESGAIVPVHTVYKMKKSSSTSRTFPAQPSSEPRP